MLAQGRLLEFGPGEVVFRQRDRGDRLFVVNSGVLEVLSTPTDATEQVPVAYLGTGEVLGELALLTGSPRSATVRSPEHAEVFAVDRTVFIDLMDTLPAFSRNLCVVLARRLETTTLKVPRASGKQLQGSLKWVLMGVRVVCYFFIVSAFFGYVGKYGMITNLAPIDIADVCSLVGGEWNYVANLDDYPPIDAESCLLLQGQQLLLVSGTDIIGTPDALDSARGLAIIDIVNAGTWLVIGSWNTIETFSPPTSAARANRFSVWAP